MSRLMTQTNAERWLARHGEEVTLRTFSSSGENKLNKEEFTDSTQTVDAVVTFGSESIENDPTGRETTQSASFLVSPDLSVNDGEASGERASEFDYDGRTYRVVTAVTLDNGFQQVTTERDRT